MWPLDKMLQHYETLEQIDVFIPFEATVPNASNWEMPKVWVCATRQNWFHHAAPALRIITATDYFFFGYRSRL